jgi:hypothetical protein
VHYTNILFVQPSLHFYVHTVPTKPAPTLDHMQGRPLSALHLTRSTFTPCQMLFVAVPTHTHQYSSATSNTPVFSDRSTCEYCVPSSTKWLEHLAKWQLPTTTHSNMCPQRKTRPQRDKVNRPCSSCIPPTRGSQSHQNTSQAPSGHRTCNHMDNLIRRGMLRAQCQNSVGHISACGPPAVPPTITALQRHDKALQEGVTFPNICQFCG